MQLNGVHLGHKTCLCSCSFGQNFSKEFAYLIAPVFVQLGLKYYEIIYNTSLESVQICWNIHIVQIWPKMDDQTSKKMLTKSYLARPFGLLLSRTKIIISGFFSV